MQNRHRQPYHKYNQIICPFFSLIEEIKMDEIVIVWGE